MQEATHVDKDELFDQKVNNFFTGFQDSGMKKWGGFHLSDHVARLTEDNEANYQTDNEILQTKTWSATRKGGRGDR